MTIQEIKEELTGIIHSTTLNKIKNLYYLMNRAGRNMLSKCAPPETIRTQQITNAVHSDIFDYSAPTDLKGNKIIDIRPQTKRTEKDSFYQRYSREFDLRRKNNTFQVRLNSGIKTLRLSKLLTSAKTINECDSLTANGAWTAAGDATNLTVDDINYLTGSASLNFDLNALGSVGYIENSDMSAVDLTNEDEVSSLWVRVYIPDITIITNFILRWGNSALAYWHKTVTTPHDQSTFKNGWNILRFDWNGATEVGVVDPSAIDYLRLSVTYNGTAETDLRVDRIACSTGQLYEIEYYSDCLFRTSAGVWIVRPTDDTDIINLGEDGINIFLYECGLAMAQQNQGEDAVFDFNYFGGASLKELYSKYKKNNPDQSQKPIEFYY